MDALKGIIFLIINGAGWFFTGYVMGQSRRHALDDKLIVLLSSLAASIALAVLAVLEGAPPRGTGLWICLACQGLTGVTCGLQLKTMSDAMQRGPNGIVWSILQSAFIFPFIVGVLFFPEACTCNVLNVLGILVVLGAMMLLGASKGTSASGSWLGATMICYLFTAMTQVFNNIPSFYGETRQVSSTWRLLFVDMGTALCGLCFLFDRQEGKLWHRLRPSLTSQRFWCYTLTMAVMGCTFALFLAYPGMDAMSRAGIGAFSYPLMVSSSIVAFEIYALAILRERRTLVQLAATLCIMVGAVLLCIKSN